MENQLTGYADAKRAVIYINDYDYGEVDRFLQEGVKNIPNHEIYEYRAIGELDFKTKEIVNTTDVLKFLQSYYIFGAEKNIILLLKDVDEELKNTKVIAFIKKIAEMNMYHIEYNCMVVLVSEEAQPPKELENYVTIVEIPKLNEQEIRDYIVELAQSRGQKVAQEDLGEIAISLKGLSKWYITQIVNMMDIISTSNINKIIREKGQIIKKSGILELIDFKEKATDIGGLENLKEWLTKKAKVFRRLDEARKFGVDTPKGLLLVGMPGCGKSLSAKVASRMFNVPLLRLDIGRLLGKYVGESESNLRTALKMAEAISPCILWIDEIEKAFAGVDQSGGASDITKRLFGHFLTWLQEKENTVFVVATANDISSFPAEFMRKGRFDEIFYVDFPNRDEREEIFRIHLEKRGQYNEEYIDLTKLATETNGYSGADIEEVVKLAVEEMFLTDVEEGEEKIIYTEDILDAVKSIDSMTSILEEKIKGLREAFEKFKLKRASLKEGEKKVVRAKKNVKRKQKGSSVEVDDKGMILVQGGKYKPSFYNDEREVQDIYVGKWAVTQDEWKEIMGTDPSKFKGPRRPVECISWVDALEYCNKLSEKYGLQPVYKIENGELTRIIHSDGEEVYPDQADFKKTEGYRLPTEIEWEWFASGGDVALQDGTFDYKYSGSNDVNEVAWYVDNSGNATHAVGTKKPNQLGLYDCSGNVLEWIYDTATDGYISEDKPYIYDGSSRNRGLKGSSWCHSVSYCEVSCRYCYACLTGQDCNIGFRVVRTA